MMAGIREGPGSFSNSRKEAPAPRKSGPNWSRRSDRPGGGISRLANASRKRTIVDEHLLQHPARPHLRLGPDLLIPACQIEAHRLRIEARAAQPGPFVSGRRDLSFAMYE